MPIAPFSCCNWAARIDSRKFWGTRTASSIPTVQQQARGAEEQRLLLSSRGVVDSRESLASPRDRRHSSPEPVTRGEPSLSSRWRTSSCWSFSARRTPVTSAARSAKLSPAPAGLMKPTLRGNHEEGGWRHNAQHKDRTMGTIVLRQPQAHIIQSSSLSLFLELRLNVCGLSIWHTDRHLQLLTACTQTTCKQGRRIHHCVCLACWTKDADTPEARDDASSGKPAGEEENSGAPDKGWISSPYVLGRRLGMKQTEAKNPRGALPDLRPRALGRTR